MNLLKPGNGAISEKNNHTQSDFINQPIIMSPIFLLGFMGTGKTHWGKIWAAESGLSFVDLDIEVEKDAGKSISNIFKDDGESGFRELEAKKLREQGNATNTLIATGGGTPCFHDNISWMNNCGVTVFLNAIPQYIFNRIIQEKDNRPLLKNMDHDELLLYIQNKMKQRMPYYSQASFCLQCESLNNNSLKQIISVIKNKNA